MLRAVKIVSASLFLLALSLFAQAPTGEITGTITDQSGAAIVGSTITLTNNATGAQRTVLSNDSGNFDIPALPPGSYSIRVESKGFRNEDRKGVKLPLHQLPPPPFS